MSARTQSEKVFNPFLLRDNFMTVILGERVFLKVSQPYLKTSDPMPMLRPPDLVSLDEVGEVVALLPKDMAEVKFRRGNFLISIEHLKLEQSKLPD